MEDDNKMDIKEDEIEGTIIDVGIVCILGQGWGSVNALPDEQAVSVLKKWGVVYTTESEKLGDIKWRVKLNSDLVVRDKGNGGKYIVTNTESHLKLGNVEFWGTTSVDIEATESYLNSRLDNK